MSSATTRSRRRSGCVSTDIENDIPTDHEPTEPYYELGKETSTIFDIDVAQFDIGGAKFNAAQLEPRGIEYLELDAETYHLQAILQLEELPDDIERQYAGHSPTGPSRSICEYYRNVPGLHNTTAWVEPNEELLDKIIREWLALKDYGMIEIEYQMLASKTFLMTEPRHSRVVTPKTNTVKAEILHQAKIAPCSTLWTTPPFLGEPQPGFENTKAWDFPLSPDSTFWVSLDDVDMSYVDSMDTITYVRAERLVHPYLTVEFKSNSNVGSTRKAQHQLVSSAALFLYNRWKLRKRRHTVCNTPWKEADTDLLRHICLSVLGSSWEFWVAKLKLTGDGEWNGPNGCRMERIKKGNFRTHQTVRNFIEHLNETNRWGLTVHTIGIFEDVDEIIAAKSNRVAGDKQKRKEQRSRPKRSAEEISPEPLGEDSGREKRQCLD